ncbi:MAG TPA: NAD(P)-binding domain-containing protein [Gaiellaceae bacterium]|nr:NAD(P)-binding domain-containing protein [Gaiellaceae bacterium]
MTTAIIGVGNLGGTVARHLVNGGEAVVLAAKDESRAQALADDLGPLAGAASVADAIDAADTVVLAVWLDPLKEVLAEYAQRLHGKVVVDPTNPIGFDNGQMIRTLPDGQSSSSVVAGLLPAGAHYVKAFGSLGATQLADTANQDPRVVLFYATGEDAAATTVERLIRTAGFEPMDVGGLAAVGRMEGPSGDLQGRVLDHDGARTALATEGTR